MTVTITGQALALAGNGADDSADETVPDDPDAIAMSTAHRVGDMLHHLARASQRMKAARAASSPELRTAHSGHLARHLKHALKAAHGLTENIRQHYPDEAAELEQVKQAVGLAKAISEDAKAATTAHLTETTLHELAHARRHAQAMLEDTPDAEWSFNADHAEKHLGGAAEHAGKLAAHFKDNYPQVAHWLAGLDEVTLPAEEDGGKKQHARYGKRDGETITGQAGGRAVPKGDAQPELAGTITAHLAGETITRQFLLTGDGHGHHVAGTPNVYSHGWHPLDGTEAGKDGIRKPGSTGSKSRSVELSEAEKSAVADYAGLYSGEVNQFLRDGTRSPYNQQKVEQVIRGLDGAMSKSVLSKDTVLHRAVSRHVDWDASEAAGKTVRWPPDDMKSWHDDGYTSTSDKLTGISTARGTVRFDIRMPAGSHALPVRTTGLGDIESEVLLPRGSSFKVTGTHTDPATGQVVFDMVPASARAALAGTVTAQMAGGTITGQLVLTGDGHGHHIPETPFDWRHNWIPLTPVAAKSHFRGKVPDRWHQESASRAGGLQHAASESGLTDAAFMLDQARLSAGKKNPEEAAQYAKMAAGYVRDAADKGTISHARERELHDSISALHARLAGSPLPDPETYRQEARQAAAQAEAAVKDFAAKAHAVVPALLGGGRSDWNGKVALFSAKDRPGVAAYMGWDGTMGFQKELAALLAGSAKGAKVTDPVAAFTPHIDVLHELIHSTVPAGGESAEWKALPAGHRAALSAFSAMDKDNPTGGAVPTLHSLADAREHDSGISQDTIDDLAGRGLLARSPTTSSTWNPQTGQSTPPVHSWRLTAAGRDVLPVAPQTHGMHKDAYRDPQNAAIEEGFTELGTVHHAPEFLAQVGVGDQETGMMSVTSAGRPREEFDQADLAARKDEIAKLAAQANETTSASAELQLRMAAREMGKASPDVGSVIDHLSKAHLTAKDDGLKDKIWQAMGELNLAPSKIRRATVTEYAKRLRDPDRIAKGEAWGHYGWQTAAAQQWVIDAAKAEGKGKKSPRVRELADEINREGAGGKAPAMARQVIRAAGADLDKFQGAPFAALVTRIQRNWALGPDEAKTSPWLMAMTAVREYDREH